MTVKLLMAYGPYPHNAIVTLDSDTEAGLIAAKMALATEGKAHSFGRIVGMGQRLIGNGSTQDA